MRVLVSAPTDNPVAWVISKVENANNIGIQTLTLYQDFFDEHKDYIERDDSGNIIGMWADYYDNTNNPIVPIEQEQDTQIQTTVYGKITASTPSVKVGGSYKTLKLKLYDVDGNEITESYSNATFDWSCSINGEDFTNNNAITWLNGSSFNQKKIKFANDKSYLDENLDVKCTITKDEEMIDVTCQFALVI